MLKKLLKWPVVAFGITLISLACLFLIIPHESTRVAANESLAARTLRRIAELENQYRELHPGTYSRSLKELSGFQNNQSGYVIVYAPSAADADGKILHFVVTALPRVPGETGVRYFYMDESGVLRWETLKPADGKSRKLE